MPTDRILIFDPTPDGPARKTAGSVRTSPTARELDFDIVSDDWRFAIAYNAALQAATAALAAAGYRASRENHHYRVIQSLELTLGKDAKFIRLRCVPGKEEREQLRHWRWNLPSRSRRDDRNCAELAAGR